MMLPVVAGIIYNGDDILIAKRAHHKSQAGLWEFPGGKIEVGETPEQCLVRELREELGIEVKVNHFIMENVHHYKEISIRLQAFHCYYLNGQIELNVHDEIQWVKREQLKDFIFAPADIPFIIYLQLS
ncbi:(deoxy)nucleoside triphosphate pyrophosphohydrolase [Mucilaginibacter sp. AW1-3]